MLHSKVMKKTDVITNLKNGLARWPVQPPWLMSSHMNKKNLGLAGLWKLVCQLQGVFGLVWKPTWSWYHSSRGWWKGKWFVTSEHKWTTKLDKLVKNISACSRLCAQALIPIALEGTEAGKVKASHALAKIAAISNPEIAFPGERVSQLFLPL